MITDTRLDQVAPDLVRVYVGKLMIYFSKELPIAFTYPELGLVIRQHDGNDRVSRHLDVIHSAGSGSDQNGRIPGATFERFLEDSVNGLTLADMAKNQPVSA